MNRTVQKAMRIEYTMLRTPLAVLDDKVLTRLGEHSKVRTTVEQGLAKLDAAAARFLDPHEPAPPARAPIERTQVDDLTDESYEDAADEEIPAEEVQQLAQDILEEQERHDLHGELAEDAELRRVQAELRAKHQLNPPDADRPAT